MLMLGVPGGMQNAIFAIANLFVQTGVNSFDAVMVSGNSAAINADTLIFNIMIAFLYGMCQFHGTEYGSRKQGTHDKKLPHQFIVFFSGRCNFWRTAGGFRKTVPVSFCQ